jgi:hypothetical protein
LRVPHPHANRRRLAADSRVRSGRRQIGSAMECIAEMPPAPLDRRPRKRQRLGWDVGPAGMHQVCLRSDSVLRLAFTASRDLSISGGCLQGVSILHALRGCRCCCFRVRLLIYRITVLAAVDLVSVALVYRRPRRCSLFFRSILGLICLCVMRARMVTVALLRSILLFVRIGMC